MSPRNRIVALVVACPLFLQHLDTSTMATALPTMSNALKVDVLQLNLAITAYLLSIAVCLPLSGWLADRFGARRIFCWAIVMFSLGSALCAMATSLGQLVVFRLLQGMGGAMMMPVGRLILLRTVPATQIVTAMVWFTVPGVLGRMTGPLVGGALLTVASWQWIFLVNIPFGIIGVLMALVFVDKSVEPAKTQPFDMKGFVLLAVALVGLLGGLETAGKDLMPAQVNVVLVIAGLLAMVGYVYYSSRVAQPLIDLSILRLPTYRAGVLGGMPLRIAIGASPFLLPLMLQLGFGLTPLASGMLTVATSVGSLMTRMVVSWVIRTTGFKSLMIGCTAMASVFYTLYGQFTPETPHPLIFVTLMVGGLINSMGMVALNSLGFSKVSKAKMSHATALSTMAQQLSLAIGVVLGAALVAGVSQLRGTANTGLTADDFSLAFGVVGAMTLLSLFWFTRLARDEGDQMRGG